MMSHKPFISQLKKFLPLLIALAVAAAFRLPLLDSLPPGLNFDEGGEGIAALDVAHGVFRVWWPIGGGKEPLMAYLVQPLFWLFGPTRLALRLYAALMGVGAVGATFFLARQFFYVDPDDNSPGRFLPLWAGLGLATAFWHVAYSRIAFRALSNPMVEALALAFLWRALRTGRRRDFLPAGAFIGGLIYTYLAGRFVPVAIALFFGLEWLIARKNGQPSLLGRYFGKLAAMAGVAALVAAPAGIFFALNPPAFVDRAGSVSVFSPAMNGGDFWGTLGRTALTTVGTFFAFTGDPNSLGNIPGKPELSPLLAILFALGVAVVAWRARAGRNRAGLFLLVWWPVMLLPAILAPEGAPHHLRLIGAAPATYILVALGLSQAITWLAGRVTIRSTALLAAFTVLVFGLTAAQTYRDYFIDWANNVDHYMDFDVYAAELAAQMTAETDLGAAYVIPMDLRAAHEARHYSLDFLYRGQTPYHYIVVDEGTVAQSLTGAAAGKTTLKVVRWTQDKHREADAKEMVTFLLASAGAKLTGAEVFPVYTIETWQLPSAQTRFALPPIETPVDATLDGLLQVRRSWTAARPTPAGQVAVAVTFAPIAPINTDYKASLRLVSADGAVVAQKDRILLHNWHQPTSLWPREEVNEYYLLTLPADAPPGDYAARLVVYRPDTLAPLTDNGLVEIPLGMVRLCGG